MKAIYLLLFVPIFVYAEKVKYDVPASSEIQEPWLTGPLLAPASVVVPGGHFNIEPYIYATANTGMYNSDWKAVKSPTVWMNSLQPVLQVGINSWMDFQIAPTLFWNYSQGAASWEFGDFPVIVDIQLYHGHFKKGGWIPSVKLTLRETFPTGKYRNLNPKKKGTDIGGAGSYATDIGLVFGKLFYLGGKTHFLNMRLAFLYNLPAPVHLKGLNAYGGGEGTNARFFPAQSLEVDLGLELTLSQNWALALDIVGVWEGADHYTGRAGVLPNGQPAKLGLGSSVQYSLAPAFEYNWNANLGIIAGSWFTIGGRNAVQFASGIFALNYYK